MFCSFQYKSFISSVKFVFKYLSFLDIINGIFSLISFSSCSLMVYRKTTRFYVLILYLVTLLNSFIICSSFCGLFVIFGVLYIRSHVCGDSFTSSSPM